MKTKINIVIVLSALLFSVPLHSQGFLNKLKDKAKSVTLTTEKKEGAVVDAKTKNDATNIEKKNNYSNPHKTINTKIIDGNKYSFAKFYSDSMLCVKDRNLNKLGFVDQFGNIIIECKYNEPFDAYPAFNSGVCTVSRDDNSKKRYFIIDKTGKEIAMPFTVYAMSQFCDGKAIVAESLNNKGIVYYVDVNGKKILPKLTRNNKYSVSDPESPRPTKDGLMGFYDYALEKWGFADKLGNVVIAPQFVDIQDFSEGLAAVKIDRQWGFIDTKGNVVIDYKFYQPSPFSDGKSVIDTNDGYIVINKTGQTISTEAYTLMSPFVDGYSFAMKPNSSKMVVLDSNLTTIKEIENERTLPQTEGYRLAYFDNGLTTVGSGTNYKNASGAFVFRSNGDVALAIGKGCGGYISQFLCDRAMCYTRLLTDKTYTTGFINPMGEFIFIIEEK